MAKINLHFCQVNYTSIPEKVIPHSLFCKLFMSPTWIEIELKISLAYLTEFNVMFFLLMLVYSLRFKYRWSTPNCIEFF